jgi:sedoheptulose-bisphosphatase
MIGVWPKSTGLLGATGRDQATSVIALYGPRTTVLVALDDGVYEFTYGAVPEGSDIDPKETPWICTRHQIQIQEDSKIFSPANLRSAQDLPGYQELVNYYMTNRYTLRCECLKGDDNNNHRHGKRTSFFSHACWSSSLLY